MNWDQIAGNWKQFKGTVKEKWGNLTDDDLEVIEGKKDQLVGKLQERYGYTKEQAEKELKSLKITSGRRSSCKRLIKTTTSNKNLAEADDLLQQIDLQDRTLERGTTSSA